MLSALGYDPRANPPNYGQPDSLVIKNTFDLKVNKKVWEARERQVVEKRESIWRSWLQKTPRTKTGISTTVAIAENSTEFNTNMSQNNNSGWYMVRKVGGINENDDDQEIRAF
ncbi:protein-tyrosine sulfotransferase [Caerostris extrusa]|uniref:Protein-tyrosine sulfotransferase n=1 Tax=Caerostris extrusa TaxID=172846 RepID=A0AAV4VH05_CAEEX|nr:protein-tyrosine sulfotransferase [Caerostris extrusa]